MTDKEYDKAKEECWVDFCRKFLPEADSEATMKDVIDYAFDRAYALGKQEKDADTVIQGWVGRDKDGAVYVHKTKPYRGAGNHGKPEFWVAEAIVELPQNSFPDLTWESEPIKVNISIKRE